MLVIVILFMFIFGIIGVNLFKGKYQYCNLQAVVGLSSEIQTGLINDKWDCINYGGEWSTYHTHFDNIQNSMVQMISMS